MTKIAPKKVIITCAVTGAIHTPTMSEHLPLTPADIAAQAIEASVSDKTCALCCDINQPKPPAASGIIASGRTVKENIRRGDHIDHASHAERAVRSAEVRIDARFDKSMCINCACIGKNA